MSSDLYSSSTTNTTTPDEPKLSGSKKQQPLNIKISKNGKPVRAVSRQACLNCREKKIKCDGVKTCKNCTLNKLNCVFVKSHRGGRRNRKFNNNETNNNNNSNTSDKSKQQQLPKQSLNQSDSFQNDFNNSNSIIPPSSSTTSSGIKQQPQQTSAFAIQKPTHNPDLNGTTTIQYPIQQQQQQSSWQNGVTFPLKSETSPLSGILPNNNNNTQGSGQPPPLNNNSAASSEQPLESYRQPSQHQQQQQLVTSTSPQGVFPTTGYSSSFLLPYPVNHFHERRRGSINLPMPLRKKGSLPPLSNSPPNTSSSILDYNTPPSNNNSINNSISCAVASESSSESSPPSFKVSIHENSSPSVAPTVPLIQNSQVASVPPVVTPVPLPPPPTTTVATSHTTFKYSQNIPPITKPCLESSSPDPITPSSYDLQTPVTIQQKPGKAIPPSYVPVATHNVVNHSAYGPHQATHSHSFPGSDPTAIPFPAAMPHPLSMEQSIRKFGYLKPITDISKTSLCMF